MTTAQNSHYFETAMRKETDLVLNGSATPFKDTVSNAFQTTANVLAITANATAVGRIQSKAWLLESCHDAVMDSIKHDDIAHNSAMLAQLKAMELENAILREQQGAK